MERGPHARFAYIIRFPELRCDNHTMAWVEKTNCIFCESYNGRQDSLAMPLVELRYREPIAMDLTRPPEHSKNQLVLGIRN